MTATRPRPAISDPVSPATATSPTARWIGYLTRLGVVVAVVAGVALRFLTTSHLWIDEALSVDIARLPLGDIPEALRHDGHPPLYYFLLHGWMNVFGSGDFTVRALSAVFGLACLPVTWWVANRLAGRRAAWAAVVIFAVNPFAIRYSNETRMYSLASLLALLGWAALIRFFDRPTPLRGLAISVPTGLLLLTHYWGLWVCGAAGLVLLGQWQWAGRHGDATASRRSLLAAAWVAAGGVLLVPWLPSLLEQAAHTGTPWAAPVRPTSMFELSFRDFGGGDFAEGLLLGGLLAVLVFLAGTGRPKSEGLLEVDLRTVPGFRRPLAVALLTLAIATVMGYATDSTFASRYAAVILPIFMVAAGVGMAKVGQRQALALTGAAVVALSLLADGHNARDERTQAGAFGDAIAAGSRPGDVVVICPDQLGPATLRYLPDGVTALAYPRLDSPAFIDWRDYVENNRKNNPTAVAAEVLQRTPPDARIWLVTTGAFISLEGQCEALTAALAAARPGVPVVGEDANTVEHALLVRFDPAPTAPAAPAPQPAPATPPG